MVKRKTLITKRLRRIHNAWQFWFKSALVFTAQWFRLGGRVVHHLTRRYVTGMRFEHKKVEPSNIDFQSLVAELNSSLSQITNDSGESSFSSDAFDPSKDGCIVVYLNKVAVACGVFRHHQNEVCELKRMYSNKPGAGGYLLKQLECYAVEKGYKKPSCLHVELT
ncbi:GNAT family N-acetyltransferase [Vibrio parahaemolyticus]|uniref:hypothetical protein n=2 Tax=Vibrio parahaemolyticus TaxID=670 RepID=UPI00226A325C|nr:hypothetical protein [Vibrio parahaemolyticus]MCX8788118.1 hypothetical protein [Vibrio parahaemolyticus]MCX8849056.1 hypothetical protein [Vibrio parahaemolyticus]